MTLLKKILRSLFSDAVLQDLYQTRRAATPDQGNRSLVNVLLLCGVLFGLASFISSVLVVQRDSASWLRSRNRVAVLTDSSLQWSQSEIRDVSCGSPFACRAMFSESGGQFTSASWSTLSRQYNPYQTPAWVMLTTTIPNRAWQKVEDYLTLTLSLPAMRYYRADVFVDGVRERTFLLDRPMAIPFEAEPHRGRNLHVDVLLQLHPAQPVFGSISEPTFVSTQAEYEKYVEYKTLAKSGKGEWIAVVARITLAIFAVLLFLLIDASPESLGLALFMGFEAIHLSARNGWLPISWIGGWADIAVFGFCLMMGLVFRGYFYLQIARVAPKSTKPWLIVGGTVSAAYAGLMLYAANKPGLHITNDIARWSTLLVSVLGITYCLRAMWSIRASKLWWRLAALGCAVVGTIAPLLSSLDGIYPGLFESNAVKDVLQVMQFNACYILSLSGFINISTLENRVRSLTIAQVKARKIEEELEVARSVQKTLLRVPKLPTFIDFSFHHEAASYVSGDAFYAHWNEESEVFTFLLNDVTGHGMQAALKASICNVLADVLWNKGMDRRDPKHQRSKLAAYHKLMKEYLNEQTGTDDMLCISGAEFYAKTGRINLYRVNSPMPLIVQDGVESHTLQNATMVSLDLKPGSAIVFTSDGFVSSSRDAAKLVRNLSTVVGERSSVDGPMTSAKLQQNILKIHDEFLTPTGDDRTLLVFRWRPEDEQSTTELGAAS